MGDWGSRLSDFEKEMVNLGSKEDDCGRFGHLEYRLYELKVRKWAISGQNRQKFLTEVKGFSTGVQEI